MGREPSGVHNTLPEAVVSTTSTFHCSDIPILHKCQLSCVSSFTEHGPLSINGQAKMNGCLSPETGGGSQSIHGTVLHGQRWDCSPVSVGCSGEC